MPRLAVYPGSFDPPTLGHLDVVERAAGLFDDLVVVVGVNQAKSAPFLTADHRIQALEAATENLSNVRVDVFEGLLIDYVRGAGAQAIVRGLRATSDFEYEFQMAMVNRRLAEDIETVFLMTRWEHSYLSSSIVREVALLGGDYREMVPPSVIPFISQALAERS